MKILIVNWRDANHQLGGGAEQYLLGLARVWVAQGHSVTWICGRSRGQKKQEKVDGIQYYRGGGNLGVYPYSWWNFFRLKEKPDVILDSENGIPFFMPLITRIPVLLIIYHIHTDVWHRECPPLMAAVGSWLERVVMPRVYSKNTVSTISESSEVMVRELFPRNSIHICHCAVDSRCNVGQRREQPELVFIGRLKKYKSVDVLLNVMHRLKGINCTLTIAGQGDDEPRLRQLCEELKLNSVNFVGFVSDEKKIEMMQRAWLFLNPSRMEGWGLTNVEANACGVPVLGADVPGTRDSVKAGESGWLLPHGEVEVWSAKIEELLKNPEQLTNMGKSSLIWAKEFTYETSAEKMLSLMHDLTE